MSFTAGYIIGQCRSALDEEDIPGQTYYTDTNDFFPAINYTQQFILWVVDEKLGMNKFGEEALRIVTTNSIFQTNNYSRVTLPDGVWTTTSVYATPQTLPANPTITPHADPATSFLRTDVSMLQAGGGCKRLTSQEWSKKNGNPFMPGFSKETRTQSMTSYAFKEFTTYSSSVYTAIKEIEVNPLIPNKLIAVEYILTPANVASEDTVIPFPDSITNIFFNCVLKFIAYKQGDHTVMYELAWTDLKYLFEGINIGK
jgi:hypothetical protein